MARYGRWMVLVVLLAAVATGGTLVYMRWIAQRPGEIAVARDAEADEHGSDAVMPVRLSAAARKNLGLVSEPLQATNYWRTIELPGVVVDRPGVSDRGVVAPIAGIVTQIHAFPGETVAPQAPLFTLRLVSESLHTSQLELFKAHREIEIARRQRGRLADLAESGALAQARIIEIDNQIARMQATADAYRQDLQARGLPADRIDAAAAGMFVTEMVVRAPGARTLESAEGVLDSPADEEPAGVPFLFEMQSLNVQLGQQVDAGRVLCHLADHRSLLIEGRGFQNDIPLVQEAARNGWEVEVELDDAPGGNWPPLPSRFRIDHVANSIDPETRTFAFYLLLDNPWQTYTQEGLTRLLWQFRPGSRARLRVPVQRLDNVFVLPREAVVRQGPEAYVFRQNGDLFDRRGVHVLCEDRRYVVVANDGSLRAGVFVAQSGAASIQRVMQVQASGGEPAGVHVHADGTVHGAH